MRWAFGVALSLLIGCGGADAGLPPASHDPQFDWFSYEGRDVVHDETTVQANEYRNPILQGFYPDPSVTRVGNDYYLVNSTFAFYPGIPVHHSTDLVHWHLIGHVIDRPSQLSFDSIGVSRGVFAPTISHHKGTYYVLNTCVDCGGNFLVTAKDARGPWSDPIWLREIDGIDPALFFDDDGRAYLLNNGPPVGTPLYEGHRAIWMQEFDLTTNQPIGKRTVLVNGGVDLSTKPIWIEGPHIFRKDGWYYLSAAEGGTAEGHSQVILRSRDVWGPYVPFVGNPILTQRDLHPDRPHPVTSAGHAELVETPNGEWWATFLATRPYEGDYYNTGRETFLLPVTWKDGWPVILAPQTAIPMAHARPSLTPDTASGSVPSGNYALRDEFTDSTLAGTWLRLRTPRSTWHDLTSAPGWLTLRARTANIAAISQPSFLAQRQQHAVATVQTRMRYRPSSDGDKAGLVAFQNEKFYYAIVSTRVDGRPVLRLEARTAGDSAVRVLATRPLDAPKGDDLLLRIDARGAEYDFAFAYTADAKGDTVAWSTLMPSVDGRALSTRTAGGFIGVVFGVYAYTPTP